MPSKRKEHAEFMEISQEYIPGVLEPVFRFWGFSRKTYRDAVGSGCAIIGESLPFALPHYGTLHYSPVVADLISTEAHGQIQLRNSWLLIDESLRPEGEPLAWLEIRKGLRYPIITRTSENDFHFWFDVDRTIQFVQNEAHLRHAAPLYVKLGVNPHRLPRHIRDLAFHSMHALRRLRGSIGSIGQGLAAVDMWRGLIGQIIETQCDATPTPFWPNGKQYACAASHDLDTAACFLKPKLLEQFRSIDEDCGMLTAWMVVTANMAPGRAALDDLHDHGHEIGFHGTNHDHRLAFASPAEMARRVAEVKTLVSYYGSTGFRSPAYLRTPNLYRAIDDVLAYDMSMHDAIEGVCRPSPANEGCGTCHPFILHGTDLLEIPTTVPEDWQFDLMGVTDCDNIVSSQLESIARIKLRGGVANALTHTEPEPTTKPFMIQAYRHLMTHLANDEQAWLATPGEINRWWRMRSASIEMLWTHGVAFAPVSASAHDILRPQKPRHSTTLT